MAASAWTPVDETADTAAWTPVDETPTAPPVAALTAGRPRDSIAGKVQGFASDLSGDIKYGTGRTLPGRLLQKMGASGTNAGVSEQTGDFMASAPLGATKMVQGGAELAQSGQRWQGAKDVASGAMQAATIPASFVGPEAAASAPSKIAKLLPSAERAGQMLNEVKSVAGSVPINPNTPGEVALRIQSMAQSGGTMPKVVRDFLTRVTKPGGEPLTYSEARDFYINATRLSADEYNRLTPGLKFQVTQFTRALGQSIQEAASTVGQGGKYADAMVGYHRAKQFQGAVDTAKDVILSEGIKGAAKGIGAVGGGAGTYAVIKALRKK